MGSSSWPSKDELDRMRKKVAAMGEYNSGDVRVVVSPYRICPLGAHIDHQGGTVSAMTINKGVLLGFIPSDDGQVLLQSGQFRGKVSFRVDEVQHPRKSVKDNVNMNTDGSFKDCEECDWGNYARGALYALQRGGHQLNKGITGFICGYKGLDSSGLSSSAAVGVAYLLALECANSLTILPSENIELDQIIENEYFGLQNGILDQSAILLSSYGCLTCMNCKVSQIIIEEYPKVQNNPMIQWPDHIHRTKEHTLICPPKSPGDEDSKDQEVYRILLAFSGLKHALANNPGYNSRVSECREAATVLLHASGKEKLDPLLCNVEIDAYEAHKGKLQPNLARRAAHYFSENMRITEGLKAWASGNFGDFGKLISASGLSSIQNYECGCEPLIQLYRILLRAPGVFGARFSGAGFRGCCIAFVDANLAVEAASFVRDEYRKVQPKLASQLNSDADVLICEAGDSAHII